MLEAIKDTIEKFFSQKIQLDEKGKHYEISHKATGIIAGITAYLLISAGALTIIEHPVWGTARILYGFIILLPMAYYQMRAAEKESGISERTEVK